MNWQTAVNSIPQNILTFANDIARNGGETWAVGGWVRDILAGRNPKDVDLEVTGVSVDTFETLPYWNVSPAGHRMGVYLVSAGTGCEAFEVALPQTRERFGPGHADERAVVDTSLSITESLARRDFTMNAMAVNIITGGFVDPFLGENDLLNGVLREVDPVNFALDPVRVLRGMRFVSTHSLTPTQSVINSAREFVNLGWHIDDNRMRTEWEKWSRSASPANGIRFLVDTGWIAIFPALAALADVDQDPIWHPEGSVLNHTILALDNVNSNDPIVTWAVLLHDIGKVVCTVTDGDAITSPGHASAGADMVPDTMRQFGFDIPVTRVPQWVQAIANLVNEHMWLMSFNTNPSNTAIRRMARRIAPATVAQWAQVAFCDVFGRDRTPDQDTGWQIVRTAERAAEMHIAQTAPQPIVMGRHLIDMGMRPGPHFGAILDAAMDAQMAGEFATLEDGIAWVWNTFGN